MFLKKLLKPAAFALTAFTASALINCHSAVNIINGHELEGWRVEEDNDVFYMKLEGRASERAEEKDDFSMKKTTCVESTGLQAKDKIIQKMLGEYVSSSSTVLDGEMQAFILESARNGMIRGVNMKECKSLRDGWLNCQCVYFISGPNLKNEFKLQVEKAQEDFYNR